MKVAVVGTGAMGGLFAARLALSQVSVAVVEIAPAVLDAIRSQGLVIEDAGGRVAVPVQATADPGEIGPVDVVLFYVKAHHTATAAEQAAPLVGPNTTIVSLQNGWGNADVLARFFPPEQIVIGITYNSATVIGPGVSAHTGRGPGFIGPYVDDAPLDRAAAVQQMIAAAGFDITLTPQIKTEIWKKLVLNAATLPTAALSRLNSGNLGQPGPLLDLVDALAAEAVTVGQAQGYDLDLEERIQRIHTILRGAGHGKASMLQDVEGHRKTEIEVINGAVIRAAEAHGIVVPLNRAMLALVNGLERSWQQ